MELKEQPFKITLFADLKKLFSQLSMQVVSQINVQKLEIETLCRQNVALKQQLLEYSQSLQKCKLQIELQ